MAATGVDIRRYRPNDAAPTFECFHRAIRITAADHYDPDQIRAWASSYVSVVDWAHGRQTTETWVAESDGVVVGFIEIEPAGHIGMLYVDPAAGRRGIATALLSHVRRLADDRGVPSLTVDASLTARSFFERHGFTVVRAQQVERSGAILTNYRMQGASGPPFHH